MQNTGLITTYSNTLICAKFLLYMELVWLARPSSHHSHEGEGSSKGHFSILTSKIMIGPFKTPVVNLYVVPPQLLSHQGLKWHTTRPRPLKLTIEKLGIGCLVTQKCSE